VNPNDLVRDRHELNNVGEVRGWSNGLQLVFNPSDLNQFEVELSDITFKCEEDTKKLIKNFYENQTERCICHLKDINVSPPGQRIKYDIKFFENFVDFSSKKYDFKIVRDKVVKIIRGSVSENSQTFVLL